MSSLKPSILLLSLSQLGMEESNDHLYTALRQRAELAHLSTAQAAIKRLARTPTPQAVIVTDAGVTEPDNCNVLERLVSYAKGGGIVVFACQFSSFVKYDDLSAMFTVMWKLPWTAGDYGRRDLRLNRAAKCVDTGKLVQKLYTKVLQLANVSREDAIYRSANTHSRAGDTISTPAAYTAIERGRVGFIGDVNFIPEFTRVILEMCFPKHLPSTSSGPETTSPSVLILSLNKESWTEESYAQLYRGLRKNATVSEVLSANAAKHALNNSSPSAVLVTDAAIHERKHRSLLAQVIQYARAGGRVVLGLNFSNHFTLGSGPQFFSQWGFPSWDVGSYHRSTFALNPAGVPTPLNSNALFSEYSMKTLHITGINTREDAVYLPTESSHVESMVFPNVQITGSGLEESPAVFARVGDGYLGYVGDVNGEQPSIRLLIEMCGVKVKAGDLGAELRTAEVTLHPDGTVDAVKETILEKPLPVPRAPRAREAEVVARAAKRAANSRAKAVKAEKLKTEVSTRYLIALHYPTFPLGQHVVWKREVCRSSGTVPQSGIRVQTFASILDEPCTSATETRTASVLPVIACASIDQILAGY
ncbi:hypothetical protein CERSUDRAFT_156736 [Gelatoporia subvermispora B]|uniref:Uncharacterized protein n=1 Tax=Ceriporiopsis subvermispora (strain B) TaxID=914234 RepID=M2QV90_CERS8|nr:hypothetical protein CERSUDRAFT_156736 [Gelatoporia subvermispora B]